jgi:hypothetical protein
VSERERVQLIDSTEEVIITTEVPYHDLFNPIPPRSYGLLKRKEKSALVAVLGSHMKD